MDGNVNPLVLIAFLSAPPDEPPTPSWTRQATHLIQRGLVETGKIVTQSGRWLMERLPNDSAPKKPTSYLDVNVRLKDVDLAEFVKGLGIKLSFPVEGKLTLDVQASLPVDTPGDVKAYRVKGTATASRLVISGVEMKDVTAKIRYDGGVLHLDELTGALPAKPRDGTFKGQARLGVVPEGELKASLTFDRLPLSQFRSLAGGRDDLSGTVSGSAEVSVPSGKLRDPAEWMVDGLVRAERASIYGLTVEKGTATVRARKGVLKITDLDATLDGAGVNGSAEANLLAPYRYIVKLALKKGDLASLNKLAPDLRLPVTVQGSFAVTTDLAGTLSPFTLKATGSATGSDLKIQAVRVAALRFNWSFEDSLKLTDVRATLYEGEVTGTATVPMNAKQAGSLDLRFDNVDVGALVHDIPAIPLKLEGKASGSIKGKSPAVDVGERTYDADLELQAPKLRVQNFPTEKLTGTVSYRKGVAEYHLKGGLLGGTFDLDGRIPPRAEPTPAKPEPEGRLRINNAQLGRLWEVYGGRESLGQLRGTVDVQLDFRHTGMDSLPVGNGKVSVRRLRWGDQDLGDTLGADVVLTEGELRLRDVRGTLADGTLRGGIRVNLRDFDRSAFNLALDRADASKLLAPFPELAGVVQGTADLRLRGTFGRVWRGGGDVMLTRGTVMGVEVSEWRLPVRFEWVPGRGRANIDIDETTAQAGRGRITGRASLSMGDSTRLEGNLRFSDVEARTVLRQSLDNNQVGTGRLQGTINFSGTDVRSFNDITARVDLSMSQAQAFQFPILSQLGPLIVPGRSNETFQNGELRGLLSNGIFRVERLALAGNTVSLYADGTISTGGRLNLDMIVATNRIGVSPAVLRLLNVKIPPVGPIPLTLIIQVADLISNQSVHLHVTGTTRSPSVQVQPLATLTDEAVRFFLMRLEHPSALTRFGFDRASGLGRVGPLPANFREDFLRRFISAIQFFESIQDRVRLFGLAVSTQGAGMLQGFPHRDPASVLGSRFLLQFLLRPSNPAFFGWHILKRRDQRVPGFACALVIAALTLAESLLVEPVRFAQFSRTVLVQIVLPAPGILLDLGSVGILGVFCVQGFELLVTPGLVVRVLRFHQRPALLKGLLRVVRPERPDQDSHTDGEKRRQDRGMIDKSPGGSAVVLPVEFLPHQPTHERRRSLPAIPDGGLGRRHGQRFAHARRLARQRVRGRLSDAVELAADRLQPSSQNARIRRPFLGFFFQQVADDLVEVGGNLGNNRPRSVELGVAMLVQQIEDVQPYERSASGQQRVQHTAERIEIAAFRCGLALGLLGRKVLGGADDSAGTRQVLGRKDVSDAEIGEFHLSGGHQDQVRGLHVAVDDSAVVSMFQGRAYLRGHVENLRPAEALLVVQHIGAVASLNVFHHEIEKSFVSAGLVKVDDVRVIELSQDVDLALKALDGAGVRGQFASEHLDGRAACAALLVSQVNAPHAPAANLALQNPVAEFRAVHGC